MIRRYLYFLFNVRTKLVLVGWPSESRSVMSNSLWPHGLYSPWILQARILEWVAFPFSRGSSHPRDRTQVFHLASGFFTSWATREAQEYWSGQPIPSPVDLPNPGIKPMSPALQADSLPTELSGKLRMTKGRPLISSLRFDPISEVGQYFS